MKSKNREKSSNGSERSSQERCSKFEKSEEKSDRHYRNRDSKSDSPRHSDMKKSSNDDRNFKNDKVDHDVLSIYIGNVDYSATEEELRDSFLDCGGIVRVTIIKNMKTGHPKGAAFIEFIDKDGVEAALNQNGKELKGRPLIVTTKKPRPESRSKESRKSFRSSSRSRSRNIGFSSRQMERMDRRMPPMGMPSMRMPRMDRYEHMDVRYRRPPPEFYDPYMMSRPNHNWPESSPPMYHGHSRMMHTRPPMHPHPRYHPYSYRK